MARAIRRGNWIDFHVSGLVSRLHSLLLRIMTISSWNSAASAFLAYGYPDENLKLIRRIAESLGIERYESINSRAYLKAIRSDRNRPLQIHMGYTVGFTSEQEVLDTAGDVDRWKRSNGTWGVTHPVNQIRD